jgi:tagatose-6-phosphate ketose/aldose isomerase
MDLSRCQQEIGALLDRPVESQLAAGYYHTVREICQQPLTWKDSGSRVVVRRDQFASLLEGCRSVVLTGSGSSQYAGECVSPALQVELGLPVQTVSGGSLLMEGVRALPCTPCLLVSIARSGESPESLGAVEQLLKGEAEVRHLVITCNQEGPLATRYAGDPRLLVITLDERTNDRSLAMTSSFTNLVLAARALGKLTDPAAYLARLSDLSRQAAWLLGEKTDALAGLARSAFRKAVYLGSNCRYGAAREAALKMLEMTGGRVMTMAETYLGLRHGPMCLIDDETLVVCFLASDPLARAYEADLICELNRKHLGARKLLLGQTIFAGLAAEGDMVLEFPGTPALADEDVPVLDVMAAQLLALFRCLQEGLHPDSPSTDGVIQRVVERFRIHPWTNGE